MALRRWTLLLVAPLLGVSALPAQPYLGPPGFGGGGFSYSRVSGRGAFTIGFGVSTFRGGYYPPAFSPIGPSVTRVTIVNVAPPPIFVLPPPVHELDVLPPDILPRNRLAEPPVMPEVPPPPPPRPKVEVLPKKEVPERELPPRLAPLEDARDEHARLVRAGRDAFANSEYARAAARFRQAIRVEAVDALTYFLLAQALLSQGEYHAAFDAISDGMRRKPDWPSARFRPLDLHGDNADEYGALLEAMRRTGARHPDDPVFLFLRAYVLWFDGRQALAGPLFRRAMPGLKDPLLAHRFLAVLPDDPVL